MSNVDNDINPPENNNSEALTTSFLEADVALVALDSANVGIWIMDAHSGEFRSSKRTKMLFGHEPDEELSFEQAMQSVAEKHQKIVLKAVLTAINNKTSLYIECPVFLPSDQKHRWLSITGGFGSADTVDSFFSGIVIDITKQKQNEMRRSKFIGMVSHELKTPLTALKAYVQLLSNWAKKQKDNFTIGALSKVERQVKKMLSMINGLLSLSGAEAGKIHLTKQSFSISELMDEVIEETMFLTSSHQIIRVPCEPITVNADRDKIEQVLVNLLSNAAKYSSKDLPIEIACTHINNFVEVAIKDQGMGIAADNLAQLFDPHYRVERVETEKIAGFGIGLYLCAEIVKRHNGKIWVESELGIGSIFKFTLPL
ncbi:ATP-binding protein [Pedobacter sp. JCM 36344]|uniref:PAS domain-containing sensor histidine kinase n=1 Tax=Pedobacter sp. JCM 36344 TaxID=3374280 RepID=UPI00397A18B6